MVCREGLAISPWFISYKPDTKVRLRLFCFPYAGGAAVIYRAWSRLLPEGIETCSIELPGRGTRMHEPPFTQLGLLIEAITPAILPYLGKPFAFFGHSMGAIISFELTR